MFMRITPAALALVAGVANAAPINLATDGSWATFDVDSVSAISAGLEWIDITNGSALSFVFNVPAGTTAKLTVVDGGFAGDRFNVFNGANLLGSTSAVAVGDVVSAANLGLDFDAALASADFSRATFMLNAGSYEVRGLLTQSVQAAGSALNATVGGISVSLVPEPASVYSVFAALCLLAATSRRRA